MASCLTLASTTDVHRSLDADDGRPSRPTMRSLEEYLSLPWTIVVRFHESDGGRWLAEVAELPGCVHATKNRAELLPQLEVVLRMTLDTMLALGEPIPEPKHRSHPGTQKPWQPPPDRPWL